MAKDFTGKSDPYVMINCGKKKLGDRKNYIPKTLNPIFGKLVLNSPSMSFGVATGEHGSHSWQNSRSFYKEPVYKVYMY